MFQYAFGRALAARNDADVLFDDASYETDPLREYALDAWRVDPPRLPAADRDRRPRRHGGRGMANWMRGRVPLRLVKEKRFGYHPRFLRPGRATYLAGYWQSERFFASVADEVREAFQPRTPPSAATIEALRRIEAVESVAIHVRRTDYLTVPLLQSCDLGYYHRCLGELLSEKRGVEAFVFSDDLAWCREHLRLSCPMHFVGHTTASTAWEDLWMMSRCRHRVIPNSSFSWWSAWLCPQAEAITFAPKPWFNDPKCPGDDVAPARWRLRAGASRAAAAA
ncbi:MAG: alpha-1,2-fucosyltransferase [Planctomycetota bacterium]